MAEVVEHDIKLGGNIMMTQIELELFCSMMMHVGRWTSIYRYSDHCLQQRLDC